MLPIVDQIFHKITSELPAHPDLGQGSIAITNLVCKPGSLSIIPDECELSIDRRYIPGESISDILTRFEEIFQELKSSDPDFNASIQIRSKVETSYTGYQKRVQKHHPVWIQDRDHPFVLSTIKALNGIGRDVNIGYWNGGTDASMTAGVMNIPTIGYSGANVNLAHTPNEQIPVTTLVEDLKAYLAIISEQFNINII
jgi:acetylornithine deacetylase/succinyl-diaminopimelate desuccinylase-like protein